MDLYGDSAGKEKEHARATNGKHIPSPQTLRARLHREYQPKAHGVARPDALPPRPGRKADPLLVDNANLV